MQILHYLPDSEDLHLPQGTADAVEQHLIDPFLVPGVARNFWEEYPCVLVCFTEKDKPQLSINALSDVTQHFIEQANTTPEFTEDLPNDYQLSLFIFNDEGSGLYLIKPKSLSILG